MKYIKTFKKLFEAQQQPQGYQWDLTHAMQVLESPGDSEFPFVEMFDQATSDYNSISFKNLMAAIGSSAVNLSKLQFINLMRYLTRMENIGFANWCLEGFITVFGITSRRDFLRLTIVFEDKFFNDPMMREATMETKRYMGIAGPEETEDDLRREVEEVEGNLRSREEVVLKGRDLENAIDAALDRRDYEEVARLSKMMKESMSYDMMIDDDIETIFQNYLTIFG
jgi:hypothetical protein